MKFFLFINNSVSCFFFITAGKNYLFQEITLLILFYLTKMKYLIVCFVIKNINKTINNKLKKKTENSLMQKLN